MLGMEIVRDLERRLRVAKRDPHGKLIPGLEDIIPTAPGPSRKDSGYANRVFTMTN